MNLFQRKSRALACAVGVASALLAAFAAAVAIDRLPQGLTATYFADVNWSSAPVRRQIDHAPSTDSVYRAWDGRPPETFSVTWSGSIVALRAGTYTFATTSDDGSWLYVDGTGVVQNPGRHAPLTATGTIRLERGAHDVFIRYFQDGGGQAFELRAGVDGAPLAPVPSWALWARRVEFRRMLVSIVLRRTLTLLFWGWSALLLLSAAAAARRPVARAIAHVWSDPIRRRLAFVVAASCALNVVGIWWGVPSAWVGDELTPKAVLIALAQHFSSGWFDRYPPLHFYVLSAAYSPWLLVDALGWVRLSDAQQVTLLFLLGRLVSVAAAAGTIVAVHVSGSYAFGRRAGVWAAAAMALVPVFVFYAKTANPEVPYVFWFAVALALYLRFLETGALRDIVLFGCAAAMAVCTKDQAYALFLSMPIVLMLRLRAVADRRLWIGGAAAAVLFMAVQNIPLNATGFISHVRDVTGPGRNYRMFAPTIGGHLGLLRLTADLDVQSWGWPLFLVSLAGLAIAVRERALRRSALCLALIAASYYVGFIAVILYSYDRYLLPIAVIQALFAGLALDRMTTRGAWTRTGHVAAAAALAYSLLYATTVDVLMVRDSRYDAERWLETHAGRDRLVGTLFTEVELPRMHDFSSVDLPTVENLRKWKPDFFVLDADYARAVAPHRPEAEVVKGLQAETLGYRRVYVYRTPSPWPWLPWAHTDLVGPRLDTRVLSFLRDVNPTIEIYARDRS